VFFALGSGIGDDGGTGETQVSPSEGTAFGEMGICRTPCSGQIARPQIGLRLRSVRSRTYSRQRSQTTWRAAQDKTYLAEQVAARTALSQAEAERRVSDTVAAARQAADDARQSRSSLAVLGYS